MYRVSTDSIDRFGRKCAARYCAGSALQNTDPQKTTLSKESLKLLGEVGCGAEVIKKMEAN